MGDPRIIRLGYNTIYGIHTGDGLILVDAGPDYRGAWEAIREQLGDERPSLVVATHGHHDHAGLGQQWQEAGVPVAIGADDAELVRTPPLARPGEFEAFERFLEESGAPSEVFEPALQALRSRRERSQRAASDREYQEARRGERWRTALRFATFQPNRLLPGDQALGGGFEVLACPGHTPGNLVVAHRERGWLFSGDQLLDTITPTPGLQPKPQADFANDWRFRSLPAFVASLKRLQSMAWERCFPGHGEPFSDVAGAIATTLGGIESRTARVLSLLRERGPLTLWAICEALYPRSAVRRTWQMLATVQGHLDLLEEQGSAHASEGAWHPHP